MDINKYINDKNKNKTASLEDKLEQYTQMSQEQLMQEMFKTAEASRKKGELTDEMLDNFYEQAKAFISPEQAERMKELIIELKK